MKNNPVPCTRDCPKRSAICHGKNPDGTWWCPDWEAYQQREAERREQAKKAKRDSRILSEYSYERRTKWRHDENRKAK